MYLAWSGCLKAILMVSNLSWPSSKNLLKGFDSICSNIILWTDGCSLDATLFSLTLLYNPVK